MKLLFDERNIREVITLWNQKENRCTQKFDFAKCFYIFSHNGLNGLTLRRIKARKKSSMSIWNNLCCYTVMHSSESEVISIPKACTHLQVVLAKKCIASFFRRVLKSRQLTLFLTGLAFHSRKLSFNLDLSSNLSQSRWRNSLAIIADRICCLWSASGGWSSARHWNTWHPRDVSNDGCKESCDLLVAMTTILLLLLISVLIRSLNTAEWKK